MVVFVVLASVTIAGPVADRLVGGDAARAKLEDLHDWLGVHNAAVVVTLLPVFGGDRVAQGLGLRG